MDTHTKGAATATDTTFRANFQCTLGKLEDQCRERLASTSDTFIFSNKAWPAVGFSSIAEDARGLPETWVGHEIHGEFTLADIVGIGEVQGNTSTGAAMVVHEVLQQGPEFGAGHGATEVLHEGTNVGICACDLLAVAVLPIGIDVAVDAVSQRHHGIPPARAQGTALAVNAECIDVGDAAQCQEQESGDRHCCCRTLHLAQIV